MNILDRDRYSMLDEKEQKVFDELHEILTDTLDMERLWKEYIDHSPPKYPDIEHFIIVFEAVLEKIEEAIEEKNDEEERADILDRNNEQLRKEIDKLENKISELEEFEERCAYAEERLRELGLMEPEESNEGE